MCKLELREVILLQLRLQNSEVLDYIYFESDICSHLIMKLGYYFEMLPKEVELFDNLQNTSLYPEDEDSKYLAQLDLYE